MLIGIVLGFLQGTTEWLPVSSEGVVAAFYGFVLDRPLSEAVAFALWLHLGTVVSVLVVFRKELFDLLRKAASQPTRPPRLFTFLIVATLISVAIGFPLLLTIGEISNQVGTIAMGLIGLMMLITGSLQLRRKTEGERSREEVSLLDAVIAGIAQGFAALPGLSRSGLTVTVLLYRRIDRKEALVISFLMSVPVSLGAGIYNGIETGLLASGEAFVAAGVAAVVGLVSIKALIAVAERVNFGMFVIIAGLAIIGGAAFQWLTT